MAPCSRWRRSGLLGHQLHVEVVGHDVGKRPGPKFESDRHRAYGVTRQGKGGCRRGALLGVVDEVHDIELEFAGILAFCANVVDDWPAVDGPVSDVPGARYVGNGNVVYRCVSCGLSPSWIAEPHHQVRLE